MESWQSIVLGFTQGITEFVPVSSSGHLEILRILMGLGGDDFHYFLEFINVGTLIALLIYFRKYIIKILQDIFKKHDFKLALNIIITCIPAGLAGLLLANFIENNGFFGNIFSLAIAMGVIGIIMVIIDKLPHASRIQDETKLTKPRALAIGVAQAFALIPGTSRSGTTIIAGRLAGMDNKSSATYSFLVAIPIMLGVCLKMFLSSENRDYLMNNLSMLAISNAAALIIGLIAIYFALHILAKPKSLQAFGYYRIILSLIVLIVALLVI